MTCLGNASSGMSGAVAAGLTVRLTQLFSIPSLVAISFKDFASPDSSAGRSTPLARSRASMSLGDAMTFSTGGFTIRVCLAGKLIPNRVEPGHGCSGLRLVQDWTEFDLLRQQCRADSVRAGSRAVDRAPPIRVLRRAVAADPRRPHVPWRCAGRLLAALRRVGREFNLEFEYKKPARLGRRISDDSDVIRDAGFDIDRQRNAHAKNFEYWISANRGK